MTDCEVCVHRFECCRTMKECRAYGGGSKDREILIQELKDKVARLEKEVSDLRHALAKSDKGIRT